MLSVATGVWCLKLSAWVAINAAWIWALVKVSRR